MYSFRGNSNCKFIQMQYQLHYLKFILPMYQNLLNFIKYFRLLYKILKPKTRNYFLIQYFKKIITMIQINNL